ncbi:MAG TPA: cadmium-translocating P-type ATPase [Clostridiaceae bacterium]|jgi:Cd2+/Zn2+-exporting ATPase|nr:cadmium-translocating P-type ATPase [Clostridiaceae bacterium]HCL49936.1 cadmium-translocating P-type ATPase [Clostridiaceae bacterium]
MENVLKKELKLNGLNCANCAAKIEKEVNNIDGVQKANVDFISKNLVIKIKNKNNANDIINSAIKIVGKIRPDVIVTVKENEEADKEDMEEDNKKDLIKIGISFVIFLAANILKLPEPYNFILFFTSFLISGYEVILKAIKNILHGNVFDENFLMTIATIGAFSIKQYPEAVAVMIFYDLGEYFEDKAVDHSRKSITSLMNIKPSFANIKTENGIKTISPKEVKIGDLVVVKPGEKVPVDGKVAEGSSFMDTSALTGESVPLGVNEGDAVLSGFINKNGLIVFKAEKEFEDSTVSKILELVQNAGSKKAKTENFITSFAKIYTPVVVFLAVAIAIFPPIFMEGAVFKDWLYRSLIFLVISCPCALVISIPLGFFGGIGGASKKGILVKGGNYLEALQKAEVVAFDKTGTLTKGIFNVTKVVPENNFTKDDVIKYAAYAESFSNHPIGTSILKYYEKEINKDEIKDYEEISGNGIKAKIFKDDVAAGNNKLMIKEGIKYKEAEENGTVVYVAVNKKYAGYIVISDEIKEDSKKAVQELKKLGIKKTIMLTGDRKKSAEAIGKEIGIDEVYSELLPDKKVENMERIKNEVSDSGKLVFVGDGINDAPVLRASDVGIAMGGIGSDAAIEAADIVIMTDEPSKITDAIKIARKTNRVVTENIVFAIGVKIAIMILGVLGIATMWEAVFSDVGVALIAILNSMRAMKVS